MLTVQLDELELHEYWCQPDAQLRRRLVLAMHTANGAASRAVIYFEHEPGQHHGRHSAPTHRLHPHAGSAILHPQAALITQQSGMVAAGGATTT